MTLRIMLFLSLAWASSCGPREARKALDEDRYDRYLRMLSPYVLKKPDEIGFADRFHPNAASYYAEFRQMTGAELRYFKANDTAQFFLYVHRDRTSLFEHYRGTGGYFRTDPADSIVFVNLLFHTPRLTREEIAKRGEELFTEMTSTGNVNRYLENRAYVHTPNADFYYNAKENRWDYTKNSSWKFLQEEQQRYDTARGPN